MAKDIAQVPGQVMAPHCISVVAGRVEIGEGVAGGNSGEILNETLNPLTFAPSHRCGLYASSRPCSLASVAPSPEHVAGGGDGVKLGDGLLAEAAG